VGDAGCVATLRLTISLDLASRISMVVWDSFPSVLHSNWAGQKLSSYGDRISAD
jgi:hypothetical protein